MKRIGRKGVVTLLLLTASATSLFFALTSSQAPEAPEIPKPTAEAACRMKLQEALRDASLLDLIRNARIAARKGDAKTHRAMVSGLKREPSRAKTLIHGEISRSSDTSDISILHRIITELQ